MKVSAADRISVTGTRRRAYGEISGSHSGEYEACLLGYCAANIALMMEAVNTSETQVNFYQTARRSTQEGGHVSNYVRQLTSDTRPQYGDNKSKRLWGRHRSTEGDSGTSPAAAFLYVL
jgi:hypothetical protein